MVEVVEVAAGAITVVNGVDLLVGPIEALRETAEKFGHGKQIVIDRGSVMMGRKDFP